MDGFFKIVVVILIGINLGWWWEYLLKGKLKIFISFKVKRKILRGKWVYL